MLNKTKRLAAVVTVAVAGAAMAVTGATAGAASAQAPSSTGIYPAVSPVVFNGKDLVTAALGANGTLYAHEQVPGATSWRQQAIETLAQNGGVRIGTPSVTATATSVQVVTEDGDGNIYFRQQLDGQTTWSAPEYVGTVSVGVPTDGIQQPEIAWTGVPGHTGTNSVITVADAGGDILYWWQNGSTWEQETVATAVSQNAYYQPDLTATNTGIVIVSAGTNGAFYSFYQPYGSPTWNSDGTLGVPSGADYDAPYVTWDGTHVDVTAPYYDGSGFTARFMWKSNSAEFWSEQSLPGVTDAQGLGYGSPAITWTPGHNLLIAAVQELSLTRHRLDFWWQGSTFTNFNLESVATAGSSADFIGPSLVNTGATSSGETVLTSSYTTNEFGSPATYALDDWTQPTGSPTWTKHQIQAP
jgi:hypothetical protein